MQITLFDSEMIKSWPSQTIRSECVICNDKKEKLIYNIDILNWYELWNVTFTLYLIREKNCNSIDFSMDSIRTWVFDRLQQTGLLNNEDIDGIEIKFIKTLNHIIGKKINDREKTQSLIYFPVLNTPRMEFLVIIFQF